MKKNIQIILDQNLVSACGLYCGACSKFTRGECQGCKTNEKSTWCKVKPCTIESGIRSCAECKKYDSVTECKKFNPFEIRFGEFITFSSRRKGIEMIKKDGYENFAKFMVDKRYVIVKRKLF